MGRGLHSYRHGRYSAPGPPTPRHERHYRTGCRHDPVLLRPCGWPVARSALSPCHLVWRCSGLWRFCSPCYALVLLVVQIFVPGTLTLPIAGEVSGLPTLLSIGSLLVMLGLSVFLMVPVASAFTGIFLEDRGQRGRARALSRPARANARALHHRHDRFAALFRPAGCAEPVGNGGVRGFRRLGLRGVPGHQTHGFWRASYFTLVALRRHTAAEARALQQRHRWRLWFAGMWMAVARCPFPLSTCSCRSWEAAAFTHMYHRVQGRKPGSSRVALTPLDHIHRNPHPTG